MDSIRCDHRCNVVQGLTMFQRSDKAVIIAGALGTTGPNVGKVVTIGQRQGEHSLHGTIWRVYGDNLVTEYGVMCAELDCAQSWLRKLEPEGTPDKVKSVEKETS